MPPWCNGAASLASNQRVRVRILPVVRGIAEVQWLLAIGLLPVRWELPFAACWLRGPDVGVSPLGATMGGPGGSSEGSNPSGGTKSALDRRGTFRCSSTGRAPPCYGGCRGFESSRRSRDRRVSMAVRHRTLRGPCRSAFAAGCCVTPIWSSRRWAQRWAARGSGARARVLPPEPGLSRFNRQSKRAGSPETGVR